MTSYAVEVDSMAVLRVTKAEFDQLWDHIPNTLPQVGLVGMLRWRGRPLDRGGGRQQQGLGGAVLLPRGECLLVVRAWRPWGRP